MYRNVRVSELMRSIVRSTPLVSDLYRYHYTFFRQTTACRGVFRSFDEAHLAAARIADTDYGDVIVAPEIIAETTHIRRRDYPILFWLGSALSEHSKILNLGGNAGSEFFTYRQFINLSNDVQWTVWELPQTVAFGQQMRKTLEVPGLHFTSEIAGADADIVITCGAMQYFEHDLPTYLRYLRRLPKHVFVNRVPLIESQTFFTLQNVVRHFVPYRIQNHQELIGSLEQLGYHLIDGWYEDHEIIIPFHPECRVTRFYGFYFCLGEVDSDCWRTDALTVATRAREAMGLHDQSCLTH
jgi:putative methyltransferase (TIGR04325 family)